MAVGVFLIVLFGIFLYKALSRSMHADQEAQRDEAAQSENQELFGQDGVDGEHGALGSHRSQVQFNALSEHMSEESDTVEENIDELLGSIDGKDKDEFANIRAPENGSKPKLSKRERSNSGPQPQENTEVTKQ